MNKNIDLGRISIPNNCTVETAQQLLEHPKLQKFLNRLNETGQLNHLISFDNEGITRKDIQRDYEVFSAVREAFEQGVTLEATPAKTQQITAIIDQIGDAVRAIDVNRVLPKREVIERLARIGIDIVDYQKRKANFYNEKGYTKYLMNLGILDHSKPALPIPVINEAQMQKIESLKEKGISFDLHIYDNRPDPRKRASLLIEKNADRGTKRRAGNIAGTKSLNDDEISSLAMFFAEAESSSDLRDSLQECVDDDDYIGRRHIISLVCVLNDQALLQDSFANMLINDEGWIPADYSLLLDIAAFYKYTKGEHDPHYGSRSTAEDQPQTQTILNNVSGDGKKIIVIEGNPADDFEAYRISPDRGITNHTRRRVIYI